MRNLNIADCFIGVAARYPGAAAIEAQDRRLTYAALVERAFQAARFFQRNGVRGGDRVGIALASSPDVVVATLALWMLDATICVLDFRSRAEERNRIGVAFGLTRIVESRRPAGTPEYDALTIGGDWQDVLAREDGSVFVPAPARHPAIIGMTSGTTGTPLGIVKNHATFLSRFGLYGAGVVVLRGGSLVIAQPLQFAAPFNKTFIHLLEGGTVHFIPFLASPGEIADYILEQAIERAFLVPSQLRGLLDISAGRGDPMFPSLKGLSSGGAAITPEENLRAYRELSRGYFVTYASGLTGNISELAGEDIERHPHSVGRLNSLVHVQIVDADRRPVQPGESGLLRLRSPGIADDVLGEARKNSDRFEDGWAVPGDLGRVDENGILTLTGRASDVIIRGGANVFPQEIERALRRHPQVREVVVAGVPDQAQGEEIAAFVVPQGELDADALAVFARTALSPDKRPRHIRMIDALPYNDMGKVARRKLLEEHFDI